MVRTDFRLWRSACKYRRRSSRRGAAKGSLAMRSLGMLERWDLPPRSFESRHRLVRLSAPGG